MENIQINKLVLHIVDSVEGQVGDGLHELRLSEDIIVADAGVDTLQGVQGCMARRGDAGKMPNLQYMQYYFSKLKSLFHSRANLLTFSNLRVSMNLFE